MTFLDMVPWLSGISLVVALSTTLWNIFQSPAKKNATEIGSVKESIAVLRREAFAECKLVDDKADAIGGRVSHLETMMQQMPDKDSQHRLELSVSDMRGEFKEMRADLRPVAAIAERMQEMLIQQAAQAQSAAQAAAQKPATRSRP